jgi:diguanylate cyclase (GGDEF)-like protein
MRCPIHGIVYLLLQARHVAASSAKAVIVRLPEELSSFALPDTDPELARAQFIAFSTQLPVLYAILLINAVALAATHLAVAPSFLTITVPAVLCLACIMRIIFWMRHVGSEITGEDAILRLRATVPLVGLLGVAFTAWSLSLYPYGGAFEKCHVAFYMSITVVSCIFCLTHLLRAALLLAAVVIGPFTVFFCFSGHVVLIAIAFNFFLVAGGMMFILMRNYRDFATLIVSRRELRERQAEADALYRENVRLANLDMLTGLPNRRSFLAHFDERLSQSRADGTRFALILVDLDGFKGVNDMYGHATGDRLLAEVGERLDRLAGPDISVARLGGDEFGIILAGNPDDAAIRDFGARVCGDLRRPYLEETISADVGGSAGIAAYPDSGDNAALLFERADYALYRAKDSRTGQAVMFASEHEAMIFDAARLERALRRADLTREMSVVFQPIIDTSDGSTIGFEALARWQSPELGDITPDKFIVAAERTHWIGRLTQTLLSKALAEAATWPGSLRIAFNLSAHDITSSDTIAAVCRIISQSGVDPARIDLEMTETAVMRDFNQAREALARLRRLGVRVSLDDFGTGFSSLSHVHRLQLDKIKIDRSFVADIYASAISFDVVKTIVGLCQSLDLECIVEGVETQAQKERLIGLGCRFMQGYLFSRPLPADQVAAYLAAHGAG